MVWYIGVDVFSSASSYMRYARGKIRPPPQKKQGRIPKGETIGTKKTNMKR